MSVSMSAEAVHEVVEVIRPAAGNVFVLTGAGMSTESGIPDYRGVTGRARPATPMTYQEFIGSPAARQRYWARSHLGWGTIARAQPNRGHAAVAGLQRAGRVGRVVTQNVDGLHQAAGAQDVIELHGSLDRVTCLDCGHLSSRGELEDRLGAANPDLTGQVRVDPFDVKPDGDVDLATELVQQFRVVDCHECGGRLKPDVVFFGESVPKPVVQTCFTAVEESAAVLVLGSSLAVMSGYRFVRRAHRLGLPIVIVNQGETRGDAEATLRVDQPLGDFLESLEVALRDGP